MEIKNLIDRLDDWDGVDAIYNGEFVEVNHHGVFRLLEEAAAALEQLQAENDRLRRERNEAVECCSGYCTSCCFEHDCAKHDMNDAAPTRWYYGDCEDWEWQGVKED